MAEELNPELQVRLNALAKLFLQKLPDLRAEIEQALDACKLETTGVDKLKHLILLLHKFAGAAGTYGLSSLSDQAADLEQAFLDALSTTGTSENSRHYVGVADFAMQQFLSSLRSQAIS